MQLGVSRLRPRTVLIATLAAAALVAAAGLALLSAPSGEASATKAKAPRLIKVWDDYYEPNSLNLKVGNRVKFRSCNVFSGCPGFTDIHDAVLIKPYPKGIKPRNFRSGPPPGTTDLNWTVGFTKPGRYIFNCTNHPREMRATIRVSR